MSDSFLINTMSVLFRETQTILFDRDSCTADIEDPPRVTFDLKSDENRRPLSFVNYFQITEEILAELRGVLESKIAERSSVLFDATLNSQVIEFWKPELVLGTESCMTTRL